MRDSAEHARGRLAVVTGATGVVGPALVGQLVDQGWRVRALARQPPAGGVLPRAVEFVRGDVGDADVLDRACDGAAVVFHLAARLHIESPGPGEAQEYERANVLATHEVARACDAAGARLIHFSTINVYGIDRPGELLDEASTTAPDALYARTKLRSEEAAARAADAVVLRLAAVYGPRMKGNYLRMLTAIRRGRFVRIGAMDAKRTLVHVDDVAQAALLAARSASAGKLYNVTDGATHSLEEIARAMAAAVGRRPPRLRVPIGPVKAAVAGLERAAQALGRAPPIRVVSLDRLTHELAVDGTRARKELGFVPRYDLLDGMRATVTAMG